MHSALTDPNTLTQTPKHAQTEVMTYSGVLNRGLVLFAVMVVAAVGTWMLGPALWMPVGIVGSLSALVLGGILAFRREPSPLLAVLFSVAEGLLVGGLSASLNSVTNGIVLYAVLATTVTAGVVLLLFRSGKLRATARLTQIAAVAGLAYLAFSLLNFALVMFNVMPGMGLRDVEIFGMPIGLPLSILAVILAAVFLILDFDNAKRGVESGMPAKYEWTAAWSLLATLVWMYVEFLRIFHFIARLAE